MSYRADIDGLRALAVLAVVLFHAHAPALPGGFVGVDVFFVISGYLITSLLLGDVARGGISVAGFYERRIRRIFPALFVVLALSLCGAWLWLLPQDLRRFGGSLAATALFASNVFFWTESGYFDAPSESKPLLHTWSLSVEEQFYIAYPLVLAMLWRAGPRWRAFVVVTLMLGSFALSVWGVARIPGAAFYLAPTRSWELLLGATLALGLGPAVRRRAVDELLGLLGLALVVGSVLLLQRTSPFPGWNALYPCIGTALLIHSGAAGRSSVGRVLSLRPVVFIGLISYSLYLWHWPILVFARYAQLQPLTLAQSTLAVALSVLLAALSWRYVEMPVRRHTSGVSRAALFGAAAMLSALIVAAGAWLWASDGLPARLPEAARRFAEGAKDTWPRHHECEGLVCTLGAANRSPTLLLWGDSHAAVIAPLFDSPQPTGSRAALLAFDNGCAPLLGFHDLSNPQRDCKAFAESALELVRTSGVQRVVLHARWAFYVEGTRYRHEEGDPVFLTTAREVADNAAIVERLLDVTLARLRALNVEVVIVSNAPEVGVAVPGALARAALRGSAAPALTASDFHQRQARSLALLDRVGRRHGARTVHLHERLCSQGKCLLQEEGRSLYSDDDHLSLHGAAFVAPLIAPLRE